MLVVHALQGAVTQEAFYRFQLAQNLAITACVQVLIDPALHPDADVIGIFSLPARVTF